MKKKNKFEKGAVPLGAVIAGAILSGAIGLFNSLSSAPKTTQNTTHNLNQVATPLASLSMPQTEQNITKYLTVEAALLGVADSSSLYFQDLKNGNQVSIDPTKSWIPASTIKAYVTLEAFRQRDLGLINFNNTVTIQAANVVPTELETSDYPTLTEGTQVTIGQLVGAMVTQSDNTAYNTLLDILDRRNINLALRNIGITETVVGEKLNLDDAQYQADLAVPGRQPNTTTAKDLATFFDLLYNHKIQDADEILAIFKKQKINNMIPALIPTDTQIAHKTGDWAPIYHDGGVVYKPNDPFILTVFTNSGDPAIIAKLAKVAYYQTPDSIGQNVSVVPKSPSADSSPYSEIALARPLTQTEVLGANTSATSDKFPSITAGDLGITSSDFNIGSKAADNVQSAWVPPGSVLYNIKTFVQSRQIQAATDNKSQVEVNLSVARDRLTDVKSLLEQGNVSGVDPLLSQAEQYLSTATSLAQKDPKKDLLLLEIKQVNDLYYSLLNQQSTSISNTNKEQFIDTVYNFYQKDHQQVTQVVNSSIIANPIQQRPAIGTVTSISNNTATVQFDDGSNRQVDLSGNPKVRAFQQTDYQTTSSLAQGDKIAIVGLTDQNSVIVPEFIMKDVPKELPQQHTGTVIEINPDQRTLQILNDKGQQETVQVGDATISSKDTAVSLSGITLGSQITVFGTTQVTSQNITNASSSAVTQSPQAASSSVSLPVFSFLQSLALPFLPSTQPSPTPAGSIPPLSAPTPDASSETTGALQSNTSSKNPTASASLAPIGNSGNPQPSAIPQTSGKPGLASPVPSLQPNPSAKASPAPVIVPPIKATTVTITVNGSGKNEVITPKPAPAPAKPASNPAPTKPAPAAPAPKTVVTPVPAKH